jgi:aspartate aminotransferase-like enzyme
MITYPIPMVPGPVSVPEKVRDVYRIDFGSADLEPEFFELYVETEARIRKIIGTKNSIVIETGEGMLALWGALKSCLKPGDRVLAVSTGLFGRGIGEMAGAVGAEVRFVEYGFHETISDPGRIEQAVADFKPKMITAVHCETPSGTLNPLDALGEIKKRHSVPLLYVDAVASAGGAPVLSDAWQIDLCLGGSQKCFSCPPDMSFLSVGDAAWEVIAEVGYAGYDALKPFRSAVEERYFPYTPDWHGVAALHAAAGLILEEGLPACFARHERAAGFCRSKLSEMGLTLFPAAGAVSSPTVTAVKVPEGIDWNDLDRKLRREGLAVGGNYGPLAGKVFRLGHMGNQARQPLLEKALAVLESVLRHP